MCVFIPSLFFVSVIPVFLCMHGARNRFFFLYLVDGSRRAVEAPTHLCGNV